MKNILILVTTIILISACSKPLNIEMNLQQSELFLEQNLLNSEVIEIEPGLQSDFRSSQSNTSRPKLKIQLQQIFMEH